MGDTTVSLVARERTGPRSRTGSVASVRTSATILRRKSTREVVRIAPTVDGQTPGTSIQDDIHRRSNVAPRATGCEHHRPAPEKVANSSTSTARLSPRVSIARRQALAMKHVTAPPSSPVGETPRLLARLPVVLKVTGLGRSTIYRWIADGSFPPPVRLGPRAVAWRWSDLDRWTQSRDTAQH